MTAAGFTAALSLTGPGHARVDAVLTAAMRCRVVAIAAWVLCTRRLGHMAGSCHGTAADEGRMTRIMAPYAPVGRHLHGAASEQARPPGKPNHPRRPATAKVFARPCRGWQ